MTYLYIETDGEVYLIKKNGKMCFPTQEDKLPFKIKKIIKMPIKEDVIYCKPILDSHPSWTYKDDIPKMDNVDKIVRIAINRSLVRHISSAIIIKDKKILMLKGNRGISKGWWHFPGGFIDYSSDPEESAKRECMEELGVEVKINKLIGIFTHIYEKYEMYSIIIPYFAEIVSGEINPNKEEVAEVRWMTIDEAIASAEKNEYVLWTLNKIKEKLKID